MPEFKFVINGTTLSCLSDDSLTTGNVGTYKCSFIFADGLRGMTWFAAFKKNGRQHCAEIENGSCDIPQKMLDGSGTLYIGVFASMLNDPSQYKRLSTNFVMLKVNCGAYDDFLPGAPSFWERTMMKINAHMENGILDHPDGSVTWDKLDEGVQAAINDKSLINNLTDGTEPNSLQTQNSQAISEGAIALGKNSIAGSKCFNITAFDDTNKSYTLDSVEGLEVGDVYSLKLDYIYDNKGTITAINGNVVTVDNYQPDENADKYFRVVSKPTCGTTDFGINAFAEGEECMAVGDNSHASGLKTRAEGKYAHTEGKETVAHSAGHSEGVKCEARGYASHAEGEETLASKPQAHAEGVKTQANGQASHADGMYGKANGKAARVSGYGCIANGDYSEAGGVNTEANGEHSRASGYGCKANGKGSCAVGRYTTANGEYSNVRGKLNEVDNDNKYAEIVGNGDASKRSNAYTLDWNGNAWYSGEVEDGKGNKLSEKAQKNETSNALKGVKGGTSVLVDDVSPITHDVGVVVNMPNTLEYPYKETSHAWGGITFTDNGDGSITANGTATTWVNFMLAKSEVFPNGTYILTGCPKGVSGCDVNVSLYRDSSTTAFKQVIDSGNGSPEFNFDGVDYDSYNIKITIKTGTVCDNLTFRPKLCVSPTTTTLTVKNENDEVQATYTPNADGSVSGVKSVYPVMKLELSDTTADMTVEYNKDINKILNLTFNDLITIESTDRTFDWDNCDELKELTNDGIYRIKLHTTYRNRETKDEAILIVSGSGTNWIDQVLIRSNSAKALFREKINATNTWTTFSDESIHNLMDESAYGSLRSVLADRAISEGAIALGKNSVAGSKCFNITAFDDVNKAYTLDSVEGLAVDDVYSLKLSNNYDNKGKITAISGNVVTVDNYYPDENADKYFRVPKKPTCGTTDFGLNGMAFGEDCVAAGENSFSTGKGNRSSGKYAFTIGKNCEAGYGSFAGGRDTNVLGENSFGFGFGVDVPASLAAAVGRNAKALKQGASAFGFHAEAREAYSTALGDVVAGSPYQTVCGHGNIVDENGDYIFIVGNGTGGKQSNAFTVSMDGDGLFAKDVANKKGDRLSHKTNKEYVDSELAKKADLEDVANAIKHRMTGGSTVSIGNISPLIHDVGVRITMPNLLSHPYPETTKTVNGITYTDNGDGSITVNGTAVGGNAAFTLKSGTKFDEGTFVISGCPSGGGSSEASYNIHITLYKNNKFVVAFNDIGQGPHEFNCEEYDYDKYVLMISVNLGAVCDNLVFHPKLSLSPTTTTLTVKDENDEVQATYTPNSDGTVSSVKSIYPVMKLELSDTNADMTVEYNKDVNTALSDKADKELAFNDIITIKRYSSHDEDSTITWDSCDELDSVTGDGVYIVNAISNHHGYRVVTRKTLYAILFVQSVSSTGDPYNPDTVKYTQTLVTADGQTLTRSGTMSGSELTWDTFTDFAKDSIILKSSTAGSNKKFKITVNNSGTLSATEIK
jgi:hypothetical protein